MNPPTPTNSRPKRRYLTQTLPISRATNACMELIGKRSRCPNSTFRPRWRERVSAQANIDQRLLQLEKEIRKGHRWRSVQLGIHVIAFLFSLAEFSPTEHIWEHLNTSFPSPLCCAPAEPQKPPIFLPQESVFRLRHRRGRRAD